MTTAAAVPTTVTRTYDFTPTTSDGLTLEGYAAVFNSPARIANKWEGDFTETISPGAFARAVRQNPRPVVQFDHGQHPLLGSIPIGALSSMREDNKGLFIQARIHDNWLTEPVRDAIASGAIKGMSFRFAPIGEDWNETRTERTLTDVDVFELGPVVFPAYDATEVSLRTSQLAEALQSEDLRHDLAMALLLDPEDLTDPEPRSDTNDVSDKVEESVLEETDADQTSTVSSAPNPARVHTLAMEARLARARARSNLDTRQIPDD